jgi:hypothetical protein
MTYKTENACEIWNTKHQESLQASFTESAVTKLAPVLHLMGVNTRWDKAGNKQL